nr:reverse transcriptase domain-containing protein [Tanacetum cinerariifolium]GEZ62710.1 reverse transcriptase domain-containing protein [Tanacetum cinerariifolium]
MRTRSQSRNNFPQQEAPPAIVDPLRIELPFLEDQFQEDPPKHPPEVLMADDRTMVELLRAPTEGYEDAIVIPEIAANNCEHKYGLINLVQNMQFFRHDKEDLHAHIRYFNKITSTMRVPNVPIKAVEPNCVTYGGAHSYQNCPATNGNIYRDNIQKYVSQVAAANYNQGNTRSWTLPRNTINNPKEELKVSASMPNLKSFIPYPSRRDNERRRDQANEQIKKFYETFKDMSFEISFTDALIVMPKFASTLKALIGNKEKLSEMARTPMNKHCSTVILNKLPRKLRDFGKYLIPCEFPGMDECLALADLGAGINLMPLSI